jgi:hypothetical protein
MKIEDFVKKLVLSVLMEIMIKIIGLIESKVWKTSLKEEKDAQNVLI